MPRDSNKGLDRMGGPKEGLRLPWEYLMQCELSGMPENDRRRLPCQTCFTERTGAQGSWRYEAVDWNDSYEAIVELNGQRITSESDFGSRLEAQRAAEGLMTRFCDITLSEGI